MKVKSQSEFYLRTSSREKEFSFSPQKDNFAKNLIIDDNEPLAPPKDVGEYESKARQVDVIFGKRPFCRRI